jgi:2-desacetyl-2-hydroxyethyl bacteriochlorophyllide A dehydrogenase
MRVVQFTRPGVVEIVEHDPPPLTAGHVRVRTRYSGVSAGTELTAYRGTNPYLSHVWDPEQRLFQLGSSQTPYPAVGWGYSEVGTITEVAPGVEDVAAGDEVWGIWGHREEAVVPAERLAGHRLPDGVDPLSASFARVGAIALNAILAADLHLGELVAIFGQGVIGLLATRLATLSGARVVAVDRYPARLERALAMGAEAALDPAELDVAAHLRRISGGADVAIEISGAYPALHEAIRAVTVGGRVVAAGFYQGEGAGLRLGEEFHHNRVQVVASQIGGVPAQLAPRWSVERLQQTFLSLVADGRVEAANLVTHLVPVERTAEVFALLDRRPAEALQVVLDFGAAA